MLPWWQSRPGNPHSEEHAFGWRCREAIDKARSQIASLIGADPEDMVFTSGATEANNLAILGALRQHEPKRRTILVSAIEHASVLGPAAALENDGFRRATIPVDRHGVMDRGAFLELLDDDVALVSIGLCNNEVGTIQDMEWIAARCHEIGALLHTDAAQALTAKVLSFGQWGVDLASLSAHKAYGPQGVGALYVAPGVAAALQPISFGGGQQLGLRPGTLPTALCVGFGAACELIDINGASERKRIREMRDHLVSAMKRAVGAKVNGPANDRHPGNANVEIPGIDAHQLIQRMQPAFAVSTGSACHSGFQTPSHVLTAIGLSPDRAASSLRIGIGRFTTPMEVDLFVGMLEREIRQRSSPAADPHGAII